MPISASLYLLRCSYTPVCFLLSVTGDHLSTPGQDNGYLQILVVSEKFQDTLNSVILQSACACIINCGALVPDGSVE